jgi:hypothetical protein
LIHCHIDVAVQFGERVYHLVNECLTGSLPFHEGSNVVF